MQRPAPFSLVVDPRRTPRGLTPSSRPPPTPRAKSLQTEVRNLLQSVYKVGVQKVHTANYEGKKKRQGNYFYQRPDYKKVYVKLRERWYPPAGFAIQPIDGDPEKGHKPKRSPVKSGPKHYWLTNDDPEDADDRR